MSLQTLVRQIAGTDLSDEQHMAVATVVSVDQSTATCTVRLTGGQTNNIRSGVRLMATQADGFFIAPADNSQVIIAWSTRNEPYVAMFGEVQDIYLEAANLVTLQGNQYGGLIKVVPLVSRLNALETLINSLITLYNGHVHTANGTPTASQETQTATQTQASDLENKKVVHGD